MWETATFWSGNVALLIILAVNVALLIILAVNVVLPAYGCGPPYLWVPLPPPMGTPSPHTPMPAPYPST